MVTWVLGRGQEHAEGMHFALLTWLVIHVYRMRLRYVCIYYDSCLLMYGVGDLTCTCTMYNMHVHVHVRTCDVGPWDCAYVHVPYNYFDSVMIVCVYYVG